MREELAALRKRRRAGSLARHGSVELARLGETAARASAALEAHLERVSPRALLIVGVCGGLAADLAACDLVVPDAVGCAGDADAPAPDAAWLARLPEGLGRRGGLVSIERIAATAEEKGHLAADLQPSALAVDLETAALARVAAAHGVPYLVVRAVSDRVDESMPAFLQACIRRDGSMGRAAIVCSALRRPGRIKMLRALGRRMGRCAEALADAAEVALAAAPAAPGDGSVRR